MKVRATTIVFFLLLTRGWLAADSLRLAVMDFAVVSENPQYRSLGKGFAELASVQIAGLPGVVLIDRDRRNSLLEEQAFSLSGVTDEGSAVAIGKLLAVDYLVTGSVVDMLGNLVVSYELLRTDTGVIAGKSQSEGMPSDYKRIVREIGAGIAKMTGKAVKEEDARVAQPAPQGEKQAVVLQNFSEAVAALDTKDTKTAARKLEEAKALDPTDPAVRFYLDKLALGTSKFAVLPEPYFMVDNPAGLALIKEDALYSYFSYGGTFLFEKPLAGVAEGQFVLLDNPYGADSTWGLGPYGVSERDTRLIVGYSLPLGETLGLGAQVTYAGIAATLQRENFAGSNIVKSRPMSAVLAAGWAPAPWISLGMGIILGANQGSIGYQEETVNEQPTVSPLVGVEGGVIIHSPKGGFRYSLSGGYSDFSSYQFDMDTLGKGPALPAPVHLDQGITFGFSGLKNFAILKTIGDLYFGSSAAATLVQHITTFEHWFGPRFSCRLGGVISISPQDSLYIGYGGVTGATVTLDTWDIDLSATYRQRPSRVYSREIIPETVFSVCVRKKGLLGKNPTDPGHD